VTPASVRPRRADASRSAGRGDGAAPIALGVTGTDTGVGKTTVAAALAAALARRRFRVGVFKPVETGVVTPAGPPDAELLRAAAGDVDDLSNVCPLTFAEPLAPLVAAERAGRPIDLTVLDAAFARMTAGRDVTIVEGAGGLLVPITDTVAYDALFRRWRLHLLIVAANRLGVLNHTALTVHAAEAAGLPIAGVVLNTVTEGTEGLAERTNATVLRRMLAGHSVVTFPYLPNPRHIPALADAADASGVMALLPSLAS
jgi:dethiobiotin synthetase